MTDNLDIQHMRLACAVSRRAQGHAEPNPTVGCVIAMDGQVIAKGWTQTYGSDHAEVHAIQQAAGQDLSAATMYVTLEPCCHQGKTPPCTKAIIESGIKRVAVGVQDPFPLVAGQGIAALRNAGIEVSVGIAQQEARESLAPFLKVQATKRPWVIAKWAMSLDGKIATASGDSKWISSEASREVVHELRGRMDAIMVGIGTALADDPMLTARPAGTRAALRVVVDSKCRLPATSQLARTAHDIPALVVVGPDADAANVATLSGMGVEILPCAATTHAERLSQLLDELGSRNITNILVEGGADLLGGLLDAGHIDEAHVFVAPKLVGGPMSAVRGSGVQVIAQSLQLKAIQYKQLDQDIYIYGQIAK